MKKKTTPIPFVEEKRFTQALKKLNMQIAQLKTELAAVATAVATANTNLTNGVAGLKQQIAVLEAKLVQSSTLDEETISALDQLKSQVTALGTINAGTVPVSEG